MSQRPQGIARRPRRFVSTSFTLALRPEELSYLVTDIQSVLPQGKPAEIEFRGTIRIDPDPDDEESVALRFNLRLLADE